MLGLALLGELLPLEAEPLPVALLSPEAEPVPGLLGVALLPLDALPFGQSAPTQFGELEPAEVLPVAELLVLPEAELLELGVDGVVVVVVPVVAPAEVPVPALLPLPALPPLCAHAAHTKAAATAALMPFRTIWLSPLR